MRKKGDAKQTSPFLVRSEGKTFGGRRVLDIGIVKERKDKTTGKSVKPFVSIRTKIFTSCIFLVVLTEMIVFAGLFSIYRQSTREQYYQQTEESIHLLADSIRKNIAEIEQGIVYKVWGSRVFQYEYHSADDAMYWRNLQKLASMFQMSGIPLKSIYSCNAQGLIAYCNVSGDSGSLSEYVQTEIGKYLKEHNGELTGHYGGTWFQRFPDHPDSVYLIKNVIDPNSTDYLGILVLEMDQSYLQGMYENVGSAYESEFVLYTDEGDLLSCAEDFSEKAKEYSTKLSEGAVNSNWSGYLICQGSIPRSGWKIVVFKKETELLQGLAEVLPQLLLLGFVTMLLAFIFADRLSRTQTESIDAMITQIQKIKGTSPDALTKIQIHPNDEMMYLEDAFNDLIDQLNVSVQRLAYASVEKERAEYNALMAQTDPHFLYNTLEGISSLARLHGDRDIVECTNRLSRLYRVAVHGKETEIPLREEMSYVESYLELENMITGGRISVIVDPEEDTLDLLVPKLIVQPIVENSIRHGVEDMVEGGTVLVTTRMEDGRLQIDVADNGKGMPEEQIRRLLSEEEKDAMHIGIGSVQRRIRILYGKEYGLSIQSDQEGTTVTIFLPVLRKPSQGK